MQNKKWYEYGPFTVFDIETTGMSPTCDRIVELAAVRVSTDGHYLRYQTLINPERMIPPDVISVHHITDAMVASAPVFAEIAPDFMEFAAGSVLAGHNIRFDLGFLQESLARCGMQTWQGQTLDTLKLVRKTYPGLPSYRLQYLRKLFQLDDLSEQAAHRAGADVEWTVQLLGITLDKLSGSRC